MGESKIFEKLEDFKIFKEDIALYIFRCKLIRADMILKGNKLRKKLL